MAIILHIGFQKTASSSLQRLFIDNKAALEDAGLLYPIVDKDFKQRYLKGFRGKPGAERPNANRANRIQLDALRKIVRANPKKHVLLSCEELSSVQGFDLSAPMLSHLATYLRDMSDDVRVIAYVREPAGNYLSRMQEHLKSFGGIIPPDQFQARFAWVVEQYETAFETRAIVRPFEREQMIGNSIVDDFFAQIADLVEIDTGDFVEPNSNQSLTAEVMFILDMVRKSPDAVGHKVASSHPKSRHFWRQLQRISQQIGNSGKPVLYPAAAEQAKAAAAEDSRHLAERYGIRFKDYVPLPQDRAPQLPPPLASVENIIPVDHAQAFAIWSILTHRGNTAMMQAAQKPK